MTAADAPRVLVVTGATRGIGREVVAQLAARGDTIVLGSRSLERGRQAAREIGSDRLAGEVLVRRLDVTDQAESG